MTTVLSRLLYIYIYIKLKQAKCSYIICNLLVVFPLEGSKSSSEVKYSPTLPIIGIKDPSGCVTLSGSMNCIPSLGQLKNQNSRQPKKILRLCKMI